jgi:CMP-N-acetylneuraminic acid synthetase
LEPTSPVRDKKNIIEGINAIINKGFDSATTFSEVDPPPSRLWKNTKSKMIPLFDNISPFEPRQSHDSAFKLTGQYYIFTIDFIITSTKSVISENVYPIIVNSKNSVDIDEEIDFIVAEAILKSIK